MIFVTGATGFLGSYLAKNLIAKGERIRALKRSGSGLELLGEYAKKIEWVEGDLLDITTLTPALEGIEKIYNCAGDISFNRPAALLVNTQGMANLFDAALAQGVKRAVHVSSTIALGFPVNRSIIDENYYASAPKGGWEYFESKRVGELEAWRAQAEGMEVVVVNPAALVGGGYWTHGPLAAFEAVYKGLQFYPQGSNGFIDVRDACEAMVRLMESELNGERFILTAANLELKEYLFMIADALKKNRPRYAAGAFASGIAWRLEALRAMIKGDAPTYTREELAIARVSFNYKNDKTKEATGLQFRSMETMVNDAAQCFLQSKQKGMAYGVFE